MRKPGRIHYAWVVLAVLAVVLIATSGLRAVFGVFIKPLETEFGWSRTALSGAAALSLFVLGAVAPFVGRLADLWGARALVCGGIALLGMGTLASGRVSELWHVYFALGLLPALGAAGAGFTTAIPLVVRWFDSRRGLVIGMAGAAMSAGQLVVVPLAMWLTLRMGWRQSFLWLGAGLLVVILPLAIALIRSDPRDKGVAPYGAGAPRAPTESAARSSEARVSIAEAMRCPAFWLLAGSYSVCGYTSGGLIGTHLIPHAVEHGFSEMAGAQALGLTGAMSIVGTIASGWVSDRFGRKGPLALYYVLRGLSLLFLTVVRDMPSLLLFAIVFGLNYFSTAPPTTTLTANIFGRNSVGELSGWIFLFHQIGSALAAAIGGWLFDQTGSYSWAFVSAALLAFMAAALTLLIREESVTARAEIAEAPAGS
jgi:MFS family permease